MIYHAIPSYDSISRYMSGYQGVRIPDELEPAPASGNPRKFRHGIYLVYTMYILLAFVILVYTRYMTGICFLEKSIFVYYGMHVCMK